VRYDKDTKRTALENPVVSILIGIAVGLAVGGIVWVSYEVSK